ncbi:MAG TPA: hypothetical protein VIN09_09890 [Chloroflexota bacterium]
MRRRRPQALPTPTPSIVDLPAMVSRLPDPERRRFQRLIHVSEGVGTLRVPATMRPWVEQHFGSVSAVERQSVVKTTNLVTCEGTLFNALRARRPLAGGQAPELARLIEESRGDVFCRPYEMTPEDVFGRVRGVRSVTASNVAKYDVHHGVVIFDEHDPLALTREGFVDALAVGRRWAEEVMRLDPQARYYFFMWNALWKSGASIVHGHAQVAVTRDMHYARVELLRRCGAAYRERYGTNYFDDLLDAHASLGLAVARGNARIMASLTPIKEKEVWVVASSFGEDLVSAAYDVLERFIHRLGVVAFNLALYLPPWGPAPEDWTGFPAIVRLVDRGSALSRTNDIGAMELYASSVVASDPFEVMAALVEDR